MLTTPGPISLADPRIAEEIDRRVAERTAELSAVIEELRRTNSERRRADEDLRAREAFLDSMIDSFPVSIGIMTARGECAVEAMGRRTSAGGVSVAGRIHAKCESQPGNQAARRHPVRRHDPRLVAG